MVTSENIGNISTSPFTDNKEYLNAYVDLIYLRGVVGSMIAYAEQTSYQDLLTDGEGKRDYDDFGVKSRADFIRKLTMLKTSYGSKQKEFKDRLAKSDASQFYLERIGDEFKLSRTERDIVCALYAINNTTRFEQIGRTDSFYSRRCDEVHDLLLMLAHTHSARLKMKPHFGPGSKLVQVGLISVSGRATTESDFLRQDVEISRRICAQIEGLTQPDDAILAYSQIITPEIDISRVVYPEEKKKELLEVIRNHQLFAERRKEWGLDTLVGYGFGTTILFSGKPGTGKTLMAQAIAKECKLKLIQVSVPTLMDRDFEENFKTVMMEASLQENVLLFFDEADELFSDRHFNSCMPLILKEFERFSGICILATNMKQMLDEALDRRILIKMDFELPDTEERKKIWIQHLPPQVPVAEDVDFDELARKFTFSGGYIKNAVVLACHKLSTTSKGDVKLHQKDLMEAAKAQRSSQLERLSERVRPNTRLEDVILDEEQKHAVQAIIDEYRNKGKVFNSWGFKEITPYGKGTIAIFHGPSGSGKTMTAEAIATELGLNLMNVSANHIVSKYVGESAQNIHQLFAKAKDEEAVILFDECESLFAARTDGNDSNPSVSRDNNQQTTVLLREIERFDGIVILTSNHVIGNNMDKAFARRIRHHIAFKSPDEKLRAAIWKKHFPKEAPLAGDIDFVKLAKTYEFEGGTIKQIALKAAFEAASGEGIITQKILESLCEFELGNNLVGYKKKTAPMGFGK